MVRSRHGLGIARPPCAALAARLSLLVIHLHTLDAAHQPLSSPCTRQAQARHLGPNHPQKQTPTPTSTLTHTRTHSHALTYAQNPQIKTHQHAQPHLLRILQRDQGLDHLAGSQARATQDR